MSSDWPVSSNSERLNEFSRDCSPALVSQSVIEEAPKLLGHFTENTPLFPGTIARAIDDEIDNFTAVLWEELRYLIQSSLPVFMFVFISNFIYSRPYLCLADQTFVNILQRR
jgi:hypothetical protein